jgi:uncharacterized protein YPO0396
LEPALTAWAEVRSAVDGYRLESQNLTDDLEEAKQLAGEQAKLDQNLATLKRIRSQDLEARQRDLIAAQDRLSPLEAQRDALLQESSKSKLETAKGAAAQARAAFETREQKFREVRDQEDVSGHLKRLEELRADVTGAFQAKDAAADRCRELFHEADNLATTRRTELIAARKMLAMAHAPRFNDFNAETPDNGPYDARLAKIAEGEIPTYEEKAKREELNWQQLFRVQVLEKLREKLLEVENLMALLETELKEPIGSSRYRIKAVPSRDHEYELYRKLIDVSAYAREGELLFASADAEIRELVERLFDQLVQQPESKQALGFLDYRNYHDYDMLVEDIREPDQPPASLNKHSGMFSGGENQAPFFIGILACYMRAYRRYERRRRDPSLALVPIDEAFSKLSGDCIRDCMDALEKLELQGVLSMSTGNIPYAIDHCDQVVAVHKQITTVGKRRQIRNVAVVLTREAAYERFRHGQRAR